MAPAAKKQLANSASRRNGVPSKFQFDITVDRAFGVKPGSAYYIKWARGARVATTQHRKATTVQARTGLPFELEKLSLIIKLYREADSNEFEEKDCKLSLVLIAPGKDDVTVAKCHFNIAEFAGVPTMSSTKTFKLRNPYSCKVLIESRFLKSGKSGPGSIGASSSISSLAGMSIRTSDDEGLDDLNIDDVPEPEEPVKRERRMSNLSTSSSRRSSTASRRRATTAADDRARSSESKRGLFGKDKSKNSSSGLAPSRSKTGLFRSRSKRGVDSSDGSDESSASKRGMGGLRGRGKRESKAEPPERSSTVRSSPSRSTGSRRESKADSDLVSRRDSRAESDRVARRDSKADSSDRGVFPSRSRKSNAKSESKASDSSERVVFPSQSRKDSKMDSVESSPAPVVFPSQIRKSAPVKESRVDSSEFSSELFPSQSRKAASYDDSKVDNTTVLLPSQVPKTESFSDSKVDNTAVLTPSQIRKSQSYLILNDDTPDTTVVLPSQMRKTAAKDDAKMEDTDRSIASNAASKKDTKMESSERSGKLFSSLSRKAPKAESAEMEKLRAKYEEMTQELRRTQDKIREAESTHAEKLDTLRLSLGTARGVASAEGANMAKLTKRVEELESDNVRLKNKLDDANKVQEVLRGKAADVEKMTRRNRDLTAQLDKATVEAASEGADSEHAPVIAAHTERLTRTRKEKELLEIKIKEHKAHAEKVRDTYEKLSALYSSVREENVELQQNLEAAGAAAAAVADATDRGDFDRGGDGAVSSARVAALEAQLAPLQAQVRSANARAQDADAAKVRSEEDLARLRGKVQALQIKVDKATNEARSAKRAEEDMRHETGDLKQQRDAALKRVLSKRGKIGFSGGGAAATLANIRQEAESEVATSRARVAELEEDAESLREDVMYERGEKVKAREERDSLRDSVRGLERRTSEAALQQDNIAALRRKLTAQTMREEDLAATVTHLKAEVKRLEAMKAVHGDAFDANTDDAAELLELLVSTKVQLAQTEDEKLALSFEIKELKKSERAIQERLASHASSLEVKLHRTRETLDTLKNNVDRLSPVSNS